MDNSLSFDNLIAAVEGDSKHVLGKFLYFSLPSILVEKEKLVELCDQLGLVCSCSNRLPMVDAFKSATGDIRGRITTVSNGTPMIYQIYCRDNKGSTDVVSRELVKETMNRTTNRYEKLANIQYHKTDHTFGYSDLAYDADVDPLAYCHQAEDLFELYQTCANRKQVETICLNYLNSLEATKISVNGHCYFIPRHTMEKTAVFETFIQALRELNQSKRSADKLTANTLYIIDDAKQRDKMTEEFYHAVRDEIEEYQERADYFIKSGCTSPAILERWVLKIQALEEKKRRYEDVLRRELTGLDDEFDTLKFLSQELSVRARGLRAKKGGRRLPFKNAA